MVAAVLLVACITAAPQPSTPGPHHDDRGPVAGRPAPEGDRRLPVVGESVIGAVAGGADADRLVASVTVVPDSARPAASVADMSAQTVSAQTVSAPTTPTPAPGAGPSGAATTGAGGSSAAIPSRMLSAYRTAALRINLERPGCNLPWSVLAGIGRVESNHAAGRQISADGTVTPTILGPRLDGSAGTALIADTDHGMLDHDTDFDRAVGPMQFIPSTWRWAGRDADGDGTASPDNISDATLAAAGYLCRSGDLSVPERLTAAVYRYNPSDDYVRTVLAWADEYAGGDDSGAADAGPDNAGAGNAVLASAVTTADPAATPTPTPTGTPTSTPTATSTPSPAGSASPKPSPTPTPTGTPTPTPTATPTPSPAGSASPEPSGPSVDGRPAQPLGVVPGGVVPDDVVIGELVTGKLDLATLVSRATT
ncbi:MULTISPECIES: lytic transglycosylase domain-containing protein [unclassified Frankia]|uniref:lytic transglycosylase domain-containing protein n=1 Tax=unclassified Frankia TaxID=2632575 RepID=UPI002AD28D38|nr:MULTISPECIES: lytic transglycosylase domain-containing protein [unclassified Frankia]